MNYLAHLYLSGTDGQILTGNFAGDYIKGKEWEKYPGKIGLGVLIHRDIDAFTDKHPLHKEAKLFFKPEMGLYSGIVADFIYDHFLAKNWMDYSQITLRDYTRKVHAVLIRNFFSLPSPVQRFLPFIIKNKRLESYAEIEGIADALKTMSRYSSLPDKNQYIKDVLIDNYENLEINFRLFMTELIQFINEKYGLIPVVPATYQNFS